jgi:hypothetical protein
VTQTKVAIRRDWTLECLLLLYVAASLVHFSHNAEYAQVYPNLPAWITRPGVYLTWLGITAVGLLGYLLYRSRHRAVGVVLLVLYAAVGLDGLLHYTRAPMDAHTRAMNFTIWFEVAVAFVLLAYLVSTARSHLPK